MSADAIAEGAGIHRSEYFKLEMDREHLREKTAVKIIPMMQKLADFWMCDVEELFPAAAERLEEKWHDRLQVGGVLENTVSEYTFQATMSPEDLYDYVELEAHLLQLLIKLDPEGLKIIWDHFGFGDDMTFVEIAKRKGVSDRAISWMYRDRLENRICPKAKHLKVFLGGDNE
jgi:DNA-directed RNA polymerase sigma subunit (sigma70/sigma32)